jgi:hypothetical protein
MSTRCRYWYAIYYKEKVGEGVCKYTGSIILNQWCGDKTYLHWMSGAEASYCVGARSKTCILLYIKVRYVCMYIYGMEIFA